MNNRAMAWFFAAIVTIVVLVNVWAWVQPTGEGDRFCWNAPAATDPC